MYLEEEKLDCNTCKYSPKVEDMKHSTPPPPPHESGPAQFESLLKLCTIAHTESCSHTDPDDYEGVSMSLEIPADGDRVCINISIVDDNLYEDLEEIFSVCIDSDDDLVTVAFSKAEVTIVDNNGEYNVISLGVIL